MGHISIRDLQKISGEAIANLPGATAIRSGGRTVGLLVPIRKPEAERLAAWARDVEALAKERDPAEDDRVLREAGADLTHWTADAIRTIKDERRRPK